MFLEKNLLILQNSVYSKGINVLRESSVMEFFLITCGSSTLIFFTIDRFALEKYFFVPQDSD